MKPNKHIAVAVERTSEYGRRFLQGVADFFDGQDDWQLDLLNPSQIRPSIVRNYDGWICRIADRRTLRLLSESGTPVVDALCLAPAAGFSTVRTDYAAIGALAAEHFLAHRFVHFAFCGYRHVAFSDLRRNAFVRYLEDRGFRPGIYRPPYRAKTRPDRTQERELAEGPLGEAEDADCLMAWLRRLPKPVAVFCCDDFRASVVVRLCGRARLAIPNEVAVLGVDNDPLYCMFGSPRISSIDPDATAIGSTAAELMKKLLSPSRATRPLARTVPPREIAVRASTDAYPGAPVWFADALSLIGSEISKGISASDVFRHVGYSRTLVEKTFRRILGKTVQEEIADVRIRAARQYLRTTALPIKDIVAQTGYRSVEYFTRKFCAATGLPPAAYRRKFSEQKAAANR